LGGFAHKVTDEAKFPCYVDFDKAESQASSIKCRSKQEDRHERSTRGDPLAAEASSLIPDRPFLTGLEGPIRNVSFSIHAPDPDINDKQPAIR
jgi:hypothetical protein